MHWNENFDVLRCSPPKGHPPPAVEWLKDGHQVDITTSKRSVTDEFYANFLCLQAKFVQMVAIFYFLFWLHTLTGLWTLLSLHSDVSNAFEMENSKQIEARIAFL